MKSHITIVLNAFRRLDSLQAQVYAIQAQSLKPSEILLWGNGVSEIPAGVSKVSKSALSNFNFGVWARFAYALNAKSRFVCVFDDDTIPGSRWLENCVETMKVSEGLLGTRGIRFHPRNGYEVAQEFGWANPNDSTKMVDIVGHSWFFRKEWLSHFWATLDDQFPHHLFGEDIHFSYALQKQIGIPTFVPPHPIDEPDLFGSQPKTAVSLGTGIEAISMRLDSGKMSKALNHYRAKGFQLILENSDFEQAEVRDLQAPRSFLRKAPKNIWKIWNHMTQYAGKTPRRLR